MADEESANSGGGGFFAGLLLGGALGALLAILYAPQGGDQTRDLIKQKTDEYSDRESQSRRSGGNGQINRR